jgi:hypothetical protein
MPMEMWDTFLGNVPREKEGGEAHISEVQK